MGVARVGDAIDRPRTRPGPPAWSRSVVADGPLPARREFSRSSGRARLELLGLGAYGFCIDQTGCTADDAQEIVGHGGSWANASLIVYHRDSGTTVMVNANTYPTPSIPQRFSLVADALQQLGLT